MATRDGVEIEHPNRARTASKLTRATVIALLLVSALLVAVITLGAWDALVGARAVQIAFVALYVLFAVLIAFAMRGFGQAWNVEVERPA